MAKASQEEVNYRLGSPQRGCSLCEMFRRSGKKWDKCTEVEGDISPFGYCKIYAKRDDPELKQLAGAKPVRALAGGGYLGAGEPALVGEQGPEMFVPSMPGAVVPMPRPDPRTPDVIYRAMMDYGASLGKPPEEWTTQELSNFQRKMGVTSGSREHPRRGYKPD